MQLGEQRKALQEQAAASAQQQECIAAELSASHGLACDLQAQADHAELRLRQSAAVSLQSEASLAAIAAQLHASEAAQAELQKQLHDGNLHLQRCQAQHAAKLKDKTAACTALADELLDCRNAQEELQHHLLEAHWKVHQAEAAQSADHEASANDASQAAAAADLASRPAAADHAAGQLEAAKLLEIHQSSIIALVEAWATLMQALGIPWEQPVGHSMQQFGAGLAKAQESALDRVDQLCFALPQVEMIRYAVSEYPEYLDFRLCSHCPHQSEADDSILNQTSIKTSAIRKRFLDKQPLNAG